MEVRKTIGVEGMSCSHCVAAVKKAVGGLPGVKSVEVSLENKNAEIQYDDTAVSYEEIRSAIEDQGYDVV